MRESTYNRALNRELPSSIWTWKIATARRRGLPDNLYLGPNAASLWVELKYDDGPPPRILNLADPDRYLTRLQQKVLRQLNALRHKVCILYACTEGAVLLPGLAFTTPISRADLLPQLVCRKQIVVQISAHLGVFYHVEPPNHARRSRKSTTLTRHMESARPRIEYHPRHGRQTIKLEPTCDLPVSKLQDGTQHRRHLEVRRALAHFASGHRPLFSPPLHRRDT